MTAVGSWNITMKSPVGNQEFRAGVDGDASSGTVKPGAFGNATFSGRRA